jgi:hypothetical protein
MLATVSHVTVSGVMLATVFRAFVAKVHVTVSWVLLATVARALLIATVHGTVSRPRIQGI